MIKRLIINYILIFIFVYFNFSFCLMEFDFKVWDTFTRTMLMISTIVLIFLNEVNGRE